MMKQIAKEIPDSHKEVPVKVYLTGGGRFTPSST